MPKVAGEGTKIHLTAPPISNSHTIDGSHGAGSGVGDGGSRSGLNEPEWNEADEEAFGRASWRNQIEYVLTLVGYAVGLGNIWRFPYLCFKNGGGAFLIPYCISLVLVGQPIFFMEIAFGQFASLGPIKIFAVVPIMKGVGVATVICNMLISIYYCVIVSWIIYYFFASMTIELPWKNCGNDWNTDYCMESWKIKLQPGTGDITLDNNMTVSRKVVKSPSHEYYYNKVLHLSSGIEDNGDIRWELALCLLLSWIIMFLVLIKGVKSLGKVVYLTTIFPYILLTVMVVRGTTLEGAEIGIEFYLYPDWSRLNNSSVWSDAMTQIFFSLGVALGGLISMASKSKFHNNCLRFVALFNGFYVLTIIDSYISVFPLLICGFLELVSISYIYGWARFSEDVHLMLGKKPSIYFQFCLCVSAPLIIRTMIIFMAVKYENPTLFSGAYTFPGWAIGVGYFFGTIGVIYIPCWWIKCLFFDNDKRENFWQTLQNSFRASKDWGPALPEHRRGRYCTRTDGCEEEKPTSEPTFEPTSKPTL